MERFHNTVIGKTAPKQQKTPFGVFFRLYVKIFYITLIKYLTKISGGSFLSLSTHHLSVSTKVTAI